jgi:hypothetical protein
MYGIPSYPGMRLRADSLSLLEGQDSPTLPVAHYNSKRRLANGLYADGRERLSAVYCLERQGLGNAPGIEAISGADGLLHTLRFLFCLDPYDPAMLVRQFKQIEQLLSLVPVLRLTIPDDYSALPRVHEAILADLKARSAGAASEAIR